MTARAPILSALATAILTGLSLSACASGPPDRPDGRGPGSPPPGMERPPGRASAPGDRPQLFISPAGEPFRAPAGAPYPVQLWFEGADTNHDAALSRDEFVADAARFFATLDADHDGVVDGFEVSTYEKTIVPEILLGAGFGGPSGGGRRAAATAAGLPAVAVGPVEKADLRAVACRGLLPTACWPSPSRSWGRMPISIAGSPGKRP